MLRQATSRTGHTLASVQADIPHMGYTNWSDWKTNCLMAWPPGRINCGQTTQQSTGNHCPTMQTQHSLGPRFRYWLWRGRRVTRALLKQSRAINFAMFEILLQVVDCALLHVPHGKTGLKMCTGKLSSLLQLTLCVWCAQKFERKNS